MLEGDFEMSRSSTRFTINGIFTRVATALLKCAEGPSVRFVAMTDDEGVLASRGFRS